jgi:hypothetical protein
LESKPVARTSSDRPHDGLTLGKNRHGK